MKAVLGLLGDNQDSIEAHDIYLDCLKVWTTTTGCSDLKHVSDDSLDFRSDCLCVVNERSVEESAINEIVTDGNVLVN